MTMTLAERGVVRAGELPLVVAVTPGSVAERIGLQPATRSPGQWSRAPRHHRVAAPVDEADLRLEVPRAGHRAGARRRQARRRAARRRGASAVFDRVRTCDNHCEFCFIYQLPKGMRRSLYLKDDDYRLSFLYGNFTTLTRFTEADLERVVTERLSPLQRQHPRHRSRCCARRCCATRAAAMSLRWLRALLDHGIDGARPDRRVPGRQRRRRARRHAGRRARPVPGAGVASPSCRSASAASTPSRRCGPHTPARRGRSSTPSSDWQRRLPRVLGRRLVYRRRRVLPHGRPSVPGGRALRRASPMHEDGIGMARTFELEFRGEADEPTGAAARLLRRGRRRAGRRLPRAAYTGLAVRARRTPRSRVHDARPVARRSRVLTGRARRAGARAAGRDARPRRRAGAAGRQRVLRRQHRRSPV